jgi:hypothetical protein
MSSSLTIPMGSERSPTAMILGSPCRVSVTTESASFL